MSRPAAFYTPAVETNYPSSANPWGSQPMKLVPLNDYQTPDAPLDAEELNYMLNSLGVSCNTLLSYVGQSDGVNWGSANAATTQGYLPQYNPFALRWERPTPSGSPPAGIIDVSYDGVTWTALTGTITNVEYGVLIFNPFGNSVFVEGAGNKVTVITAAGGLTESAVSFGTFSSSPGGTFFNNLYIAWSGTSCFSSPSGTTWTAASALSVGCLLSAQNTLSLLLFPFASNPTTYEISTNGTTFTSATLPTMATGSYVVAAGWDANVGFWFIASTSTASQTFTSASGITGSWTGVTSESNGHPCYCCVNNGTEWLGVFTVNSVLRGLVSVDGGVTWQATRLPALSTTPFLTAYGAPAFIGATGNQFIVATGTTGTVNYYISHAAGTMPALGF